MVIEIFAKYCLASCVYYSCLSSSQQRSHPCLLHGQLVCLCDEALQLQHLRSYEDDSNLWQYAFTSTCSAALMGPSVLEVWFDMPIIPFKWGGLHTMQPIPIPHQNVLNKWDYVNGWKSSPSVLRKCVFRWINVLQKKKKRINAEIRPLIVYYYYNR